MVLASSVAFASLIGSPHCLGMCGPLAASVSRSFSQSLFYNLGRGTGYLGLGILFGKTGEWLLSVSSKNFQYGATVAMVVLILFISFRIAIDKPWHVRLPQWLLTFQSRFMRFVFKSEMGDTSKSFLAGVLTIGLPCGWLYTFVGLAAATGSGLRGGTVLLAFWLGTLPAMLSAPSVVGHLLRKVQGRSPILAAGFVASSALLVVWLKWASVVAPMTSCH